MSDKAWGSLFFAAKANGQTVTVCADRAEVHPSGALIFLRRVDGRPMEVTLAFASGCWTFFGDASCIDGRIMAIDSVVESVEP